MKYSQNDEQHYIIDYFTRNKPRHGHRLLEIGAYDGKTFSNCSALLEAGWSGVLVEASPKMFSAMKANTKHLNVTHVHACVVMEPVTGMIEFFDNDQATATTLQAHVEKWKNTTPFCKMLMMPTHYNAILGEFGHTWDMVNIDIEGQSAELFLRMVGTMPNVDLWVIEHDNRQEEIRKALPNHSVLYENGENIVLGRR